MSELRKPTEGDRTLRPGFIDTHSHFQLLDRLDPIQGAERQRRQLLAAREAGIDAMLLAPGAPEDWTPTQRFARMHGLGYFLGIHPLYVSQVNERDVAALRKAVEASLDDPFFIGIGEIGLDGFVPGQNQAHAEAIFAACLRIARDYALPVSLHARKSVSRVLYYLRRIPPAGGAVHAFNGSAVERDRFLEMGLSLGFGGAATYAGSRRIRAHLAAVPDNAWVLETDAPDMPTSRRRDAHARGEAPLETEPADILEAAAAAAVLRGLSLEAVAAQSSRNACAAFPRLASLLSRPDAFCCLARDKLRNVVQHSVDDSASSEV